MLSRCIGDLYSAAQLSVFGCFKSDTMSTCPCNSCESSIVLWAIGCPNEETLHAANTGTAGVHRSEFLFLPVGLALHPSMLLYIFHLRELHAFCQ